MSPLRFVAELEAFVAAARRPGRAVHGLPCHQCSQVLATRKVLTLVPPSTLVKVPTAVWSRSVSSWKDSRVCRVAEPV